MATVPEPIWVEFDEYTASRMLPHDPAYRPRSARARRRTFLPFR